MFSLIVTETPEITTFSLHDALPILRARQHMGQRRHSRPHAAPLCGAAHGSGGAREGPGRPGRKSGRAHVGTPVTQTARMPSPASKKKNNVHASAQHLDTGQHKVGEA